MTTLDMPPVISRASAADESPAARGASSRRKRGRPLEMSPDALLERIRSLAETDALFRVHRTHGGLYARARRQFGSWSDAVRAAGVSYETAIEKARVRSRSSRRQRRGTS